MSILHPSIVVTSLRKHATPTPSGFIQIRIDRQHPVLGNPFILHNPNNTDERNTVIEQYNQKLQTDIMDNGPMSQAITQLAQRVSSGEKLALACWCSPKKCHGDLIAHTLLSRLVDLSYEGSSSTSLTP